MRATREHRGEVAHTHTSKHSTCTEPLEGLKKKRISKRVAEWEAVPQPRRWSGVKLSRTRWAERDELGGTAVAERARGRDRAQRAGKHARALGRCVLAAPRVRICGRATMMALHSLMEGRRLSLRVLLANGVRLSAVHQDRRHFITRAGGV